MNFLISFPPPPRGMHPRDDEDFIYFSQILQVIGMSTMLKLWTHVMRLKYAPNLCNQGTLSKRTIGTNEQEEERETKSKKDEGITQHKTVVMS